MGKHKQNRTQKTQKKQCESKRLTEKPRKRPSALHWGLFAVAVSAGLLAFAVAGRAGSVGPDKKEKVRFAQPRSLQELLDLPRAEIAHVDLAAMSLFCA
jgi:hypothetical protein